MTTLVLLLSASQAVAWGAHAWWLLRRLRDARRDPLTGLWTREAFTRRARRLLRHPHAVVVLADVDRFKQVNDTHGHAAGDAFLAATARRLSHAVGRSGVVGRLGGDEFAAVLLDPAGTAGDHLAVLARVLARPADTAPEVRTTVSLGWARCGDHPGEDLSALLKRADEAMYAAKHSPTAARRAALGRLLAAVTASRPGRRRAA